MNLWQAALTIAQKDLYTEWKTRQVVSTMLIFSGLVIVVFSFAFDPTNMVVKNVIPGIIWVLIVFSGILGLNRSFLSEMKNDNLQALIMAPVDPSSIYVGKVLANLVNLIIIELVAVPLVFLLFDFRWSGNYLALIAILLLGSIGFISIGTFLAALSSHSRSSEMLLPILLFPVASPVLLAAVQATKILLTSTEGTAGIWSWMQLIGAYDVIIFTACFLLFEYILEV
ncbi:heme exporter protein CcmB [Brevibacillus sp. SYSU BS000544]|uniref:heme exporter protein CcmB n=1 Tax=Brevibacillus sp. SYSU BS000544 TaxID=3416443 RepID=UPI003CE5182D